MMVTAFPQKPMAVLRLEISASAAISPDQQGRYILQGQVGEFYDEQKNVIPAGIHDMLSCLSPFGSMQIGFGQIGAGPIRREPSCRDSTKPIPGRAVAVLWSPNFIWTSNNGAQRAVAAKFALRPGPAEQDIQAKAWTPMPLPWTA